MDRKVLFTDASKNTIRTVVNLPTTKGWVPQFVTFRGKLYQNTGGGITAYFYHEVTSFAVAESDKDYTRLEFIGLNDSVVLKSVPVPVPETREHRDSIGLFP
jgi:hypothetical protein